MSTAMGLAIPEKVLDLIRLSGGVLDARTDEKGNVVGALTSSTRYLVRGKSEQADNKSSGYTKLADDAKSLGIETISLSRFLDLIGYTAAAEDRHRGRQCGSRTGRARHRPISVLARLRRVGKTAAPFKDARSIPLAIGASKPCGRGRVRVLLYRSRIA